MSDHRVRGSSGSSGPSGSGSDGSDGKPVAAATGANGLDPLPLRNLPPHWIFLRVFAEKWGPWFIISAVLMYWIWSTDHATRSAAVLAHETFAKVLKEDVRDPLKEQTKAIQELVLEQREMNVKIEQHLENRDSRERRDR